MSGTTLLACAATPIGGAAPVRVLHVITGLGVGGAEAMLLKLARASDRSAFAHSVVSMIPEGPVADELRSAGVPTRSLGMRRGVPSLSAVASLVAQVRRDRPMLLQGWMYHGNLLASAAGALTGVPVVWNIRSAGQGRHLTCAVSRFVAGHPRCVIVNSARGRDYHAGVGYRPREWRLIPNGFELDAFRPDPATAADVRRELGIAAVVPLIGLFARFDPAKDFATFTRAAARVRAARPEAHVLLAGTDVTPGNSELAGLLRAAGLDGAASLLGRRRDVGRLMSACDVIVSSSRYEGFSNVLGEALACGVPCVVTDVGDSAAIVADAGRVAAPGDAGGLASGVLEILSLPPAERADLSARARARAVREFDLPTVVAQYESLYEAVATHARAADRHV